MIYNIKTFSGSATKDYTIFLSGFSTSVSGQPELQSVNVPSEFAQRHMLHCTIKVLIEKKNLANISKFVFTLIASTLYFNAVRRSE